VILFESSAKTLSTPAAANTRRHRTAPGKPLSRPSAPYTSLDSAVRVAGSDPVMMLVPRSRNLTVTHRQNTFANKNHRGLDCRPARTYVSEASAEMLLGIVPPRFLSRSAIILHAHMHAHTRTHLAALQKPCDNVNDTVHSHRPPQAALPALYAHSHDGGARGEDAYDAGPHAGVTRVGAGGANMPPRHSKPRRAVCRREQVDHRGTLGSTEGARRPGRANADRFRGTLCASGRRRTLDAVEVGRWSARLRGSRADAVLPVGACAATTERVSKTNHDLHAAARRVENATVRSAPPSRCGTAPAEHQHQKSTRTAQEQGSGGIDDATTHLSGQMAAVDDNERGSHTNPSTHTPPQSANVISRPLQCSTSPCSACTSHRSSSSTQRSRTWVPRGSSRTHSVGCQ
jgi:hypothetical protein